MSVSPDYFEQLFLRRVGLTQKGQLQQFAFYHFLGQFDQRVQNIEIPLASTMLLKTFLVPKGMRFIVSVTCL